jgi:imidazolonepropionase-like amidohydrolase
MRLTDRRAARHAAGQIGMADQLGTLESDKLADLTILEKTLIRPIPMPG